MMDHHFDGTQWHLQELVDGLEGTTTADRGHTINQVSTNRIVVQEYTTSTSAEEINAFYY